MPKEITHWILAERALNALDASSRVSGIARGYHSLYLGGAVLPDTLSYLFRGSHSEPALRLAKRFHDARGNSFTPLINAEKRCADGLPPDLLSCMLGVVTHIAADSVFHPYVYALSGTHDIGRHYHLETMIDMYLPRRAPEPSARRFERLLTPESRRSFVTAIAILFDPDGELPPKAIERALYLHGRYQAMYDVPLWRIAVKALGSRPGSPFREWRHLFYPVFSSDAVSRKTFDSTRQWRHPVTGEIQKASIDALAEETVQLTVRIFREINALESLAAALEKIPGPNLLTGLRDSRISDIKQRLYDRRTL